MRSTRLTAALTTGAAIAALVVGCSATPSTDPTGGASDGEPQEGGTLRFGLLAGPINADVHLGSTYADGIVGGNISD